MANSNKYISHILVKGLKNDFVSVLNWLKEIYSSLNAFASLIESEEESELMMMPLNVLKGGLYSRNKEIAITTAKIFTKLMDEFTSLETANQLWKWYITPNNGLDGTIHLLQTHNKPKVAFELMASIGRNNLTEIFTERCKGYKSYWSIIQSLILMFIKRLDKDIITYWVNVARTETEVDCHMLSVLCEIWLSLPQFIEKDAETANHTLILLKRSARRGNWALQLFALGNMFRLLKVFALSKNHYAPIIYKAITFSLMENYQVLEIREFVISNFITLFNEHNKIPMVILVDPFIKQIQLSDSINFTYNTIDFKFFIKIIRDPKLNIKNVIQVLDIFARIVLNDTLFIGIAKDSFIEIIKKRMPDESIKDYIDKYVKVATLALYELAKNWLLHNRSYSKKLHYENKKNEQVEDMKAKCIVEVLECINEYGDEETKSIFKEEITDIYKKVKRISKAEYKPLMTLINLLQDDTILTSGKIKEEKNEIRALPPIPESRGKEIIHKKQLNRSSITDRIKNALVPINTTSIPDTIKNAPIEGQLVLYDRVESDINKRALKDIERVRKRKAQREIKVILL